MLGSTLPGYQAQGGLGQIINQAVADPITGTLISFLIPGGNVVRTIIGTAVATGQAGRVADIITGAGSDATNTQLELQEQQDNVNINLIPTTTGGSQEIGAVDGNANDIPLINTTNRDNFYLMYSMIQYNIQPA